jgi:hypothetical protein
MDARLIRRSVAGGHEVASAGKEGNPELIKKGNQAISKLSNFMEGGNDHEERTIDTVGKYLSCFPICRSVTGSGHQIDFGRAKSRNGLGAHPRVKTMDKEG